jgi:ribonuclease Y
MSETLILALAAVLAAVLGIAGFVWGRTAGRAAGEAAGRADELAKQRAAKATADETGRRIVGEAEERGRRLVTDAEQQARRLVSDAEQQGRRTVGDAEREAEGLRKAAVVAGREELLQAREAQETDARRRREEIDREERRLQERGGQLERRNEGLEQRERDLLRRAGELEQRETVLADRETGIARLEAEATQRLEQLAGLSADEARAELMRRMEEQAQADAANRVREIRETARRNADREAKKIVALAVQRIAAEHTAESTVSSVPLPNDEMKGRIIGREGRNIRAFELATGVDVIIDDTPDTVVVSAYEPVRREVARLALEKLVADGRIHPGRIEEVVNKAKQEVDRNIVETGEAAAYEVGVAGLHPEIVKLIGRMKWRTSYGQNILQHSKEVAWLAGIMAAELGLDVALAKRGALLHDVGKVLTHEHEGTHVQLGVEVATRYGEHPLVVNAIAAHHDDVPHESEVSVLVQAADAISGSRPGARREAFETYVKRLEGLERIASSYRGVEKVFAIQAGREVRIVVTPDEVDDVRMGALSDEIARRIEAELQYPGQIKVVVIRETRAVDFAR